MSASSAARNKRVFATSIHVTSLHHTAPNITTQQPSQEGILEIIGDGLKDAFSKEKVSTAPHTTTRHVTPQHLTTRNNTTALHLEGISKVKTILNFEMSSRHQPHVKTQHVTSLHNTQQHNTRNLEMRKVTIDITGISPITQSKPHEEPWLEGETHESYDKRTFAAKLTRTPHGTVAIPAFGIKSAIVSACKLLQLKADRKGGSYSTLVMTGLSVFEDIDIGIKVEDAKSLRVYVNADGVRGSGKRVWRYFPMVAPGWTGQIELYVQNEDLPEDAVEKFVTAAGQFIGVGQYRPEKGGTNGRFRVEKFTWSAI